MVGQTIGQFNGWPDDGWLVRLLVRLLVILLVRRSDGRLDGQRDGWSDDRCVNMLQNNYTKPNTNIAAAGTL